MLAFREWPLGTQLLVLAILLVLPSLGIFALHGLEMRKDDLKAAAVETRKLADNLASVQKRLTHEAHQFGKLIAELPEVKQRATPKVQSFLATVLKNNPQFLNITIADRTGNVWASAVPLTRHLSLADRRYFRNAVASRGFSSGEYAVGMRTGKPSIAVGYPLLDERGEFDGLIALSFNLAQLKSLLERSGLPNDTNYLITDHKGIILSGGHDDAGLIGSGIRTEVLKYMEGGPDSSTIDTFAAPDGDRRILSYRKLWLSGEEKPYLYVLTDSSARTAVAKANRALLHNFFLFVPFMLLATVLTFYVGKRSIADRIALLEDAARQLAQGTLSGKIGDLVKGGELGSLGRTFDDMAHQLGVRGQALQESEQRFRSFVENANDIVFSLAPSGVFTYVSPNWTEAFGYDLGEVIGEPFEPFVHPEDVAGCYAFLKLVIETGQKQSGVEYRVRHKNGSWLWYTASGALIRQADGASVSFIGIGRDITERKRSEELLRQAHEQLEQRVVERTAELARTVIRLKNEIAARTTIEQLLRKSESLLRATFDNAPFELWVRDKQGYCIMQNTRLVRHWGNQLGLRPEAADVAQEVQEVWQANNRRALSGEVVLGEVEFALGNERRIYENTVVPIRADGEIRAILGINIDITERKRAENALRASDERLNLALAASRMGVWEWDIQTHTAFWSQECYDILGIKGFDGTLESFRNSLHPDDVADVTAAAIRSLSEFTDYSIEFRIAPSDDEVRWLRSLGRATYDEEGNPLRLTGTVQDITERKQVEDDLRGYARRLIEIEEDLRKTLAMELHDEIGRDLTVLGINLSIICDNLPSEARMRLEARVEDSGRLIEAISRATRSIMSDLHPPVLDDYGLSAAISWHAALFSARTGINVCVLADDPFPRFMAEKEMALFRITQEALINIAKHAEAENVTISLRKDHGMILLTIVDDGKGCVPKPAVPKKGASGRGMMIMRERAELFGGTFHMESSPDEGTRVCIEIYSGGEQGQ